MSETLIERLTKTTEGMRLYQRERAIQEMTDMICEIMQKQDVKRSELALRLGKSKGYITQLLDGRANMTMGTISDVFTALDRAFHCQEGPLDATVSPYPTIMQFKNLAWGEQKTEWVPRVVITGTPTAAQSRLAG